MQEPPRYDLDAARAFFAASPFMRELGVVPVSVADGRVGSELVLATRHLQHTGQVHAGVLAAMADQTMGAAAQTQVHDGRWVLTAEFKTSVMRAARGERLVCEAWVLKGGRNLAFTEAEVWAEQGGTRTLVVKASATMAITTVKG